MRLIDENESYEVLTEYYHHKTETQHEALKDALSRVPTVEPKRGKWVLTDYPDEQTYKCSACNEIWTFIVGTPVDNGAFFCPNCGAKMDGGERDEQTN